MNVYAPMLVNSPDTRGSLQRIVANLTSHSLWHDDLVQDALVHLWQQELSCPGQSTCWYFRSCQFHVRNRLRHGRSIDSPKRRNGLSNGHNGNGNPEDMLNSLVDATEDASVFEMVMVRDLVSVLLRWLNPAEREILACLLDGLGVRETAQELRLSHTCVAKKRRKIASLVSNLEPAMRPRNGF